MACLIDRACEKFIEQSIKDLIVVVLGGVLRQEGLKGEGHSKVDLIRPALFAPSPLLHGHLVHLDKSFISTTHYVASGSPC